MTVTGLIKFHVVNTSQLSPTARHLYFQTQNPTPTMVVLTAVAVLPCFVIFGCFDNCVGVFVICVIVSAVFCIVCTVFLYCFVYVYFILIRIVLG